MSFPISLSPGYGEMAPQNCPGSRSRDAQCGAGSSPKVLGNGSVSVSWILTIKERTTKKPGQMAALVKAEDTGDRDKHEGLHGRSWGCGGPLGPAECLCWTLGVAVGMRQGWLGSLL